LWRSTDYYGKNWWFGRDWSPEALELDVFVVEFPVALERIEKLFERNRIFMDQTINVGSITLNLKLFLMVLQDLTW
jgi:NADH-quinone oxidoreductase subunit D